MQDDLSLTSGFVFDVANAAGARALEGAFSRGQPPASSETLEPLEAAIAAVCRQRKPFALLLLRPCIIEWTSESGSWKSVRGSEARLDEGSAHVFVKRLSQVLRRSDSIDVETGGGFLVILRGSLCPSTSQCVAERLRRVASQPLQCDGGDIRLALQIGVALYPQDSCQAPEMLIKAEHMLREDIQGALKQDA